MNRKEFLARGKEFAAGTAMGSLANLLPFRWPTNALEADASEPASLSASEHFGAGLCAVELAPIAARSLSAEFRALLGDPSGLRNLGRGSINKGYAQLAYQNDLLFALAQFLILSDLGRKGFFDRLLTSIRSMQSMLGLESLFITTLNTMAKAGDHDRYLTGREVWLLHGAPANTQSPRLPEVGDALLVPVVDTTTNIFELRQRLALLQLTLPGVPAGTLWMSAPTANDKMSTVFTDLLAADAAVEQPQWTAEEQAKALLAIAGAAVTSGVGNWLKVAATAEGAGAITAGVAGWIPGGLVALGYVWYKSALLGALAPNAISANGWLVVPPPGSTIVLNKDGSITVTASDGTTTTYLPSGSVVTMGTITNPDGSTTTYQQTVNSDGSSSTQSTTQYPDGSVVKDATSVSADGLSSGVQTITNANGSITTITSSVDASGIEHVDSTTTELDGTVIDAITVIAPDGSSTTTTTTTSANGSSTTETSSTGPGDSGTGCSGVIDASGTCCTNLNLDGTCADSGSSSDQGGGGSPSPTPAPIHPLTNPRPLPSSSHSSYRSVTSIPVMSVTVVDPSSLSGFVTIQPPQALRTHGLTHIAQIRGLPRLHDDGVVADYGFLKQRCPGLDCLS